MKRLERESNALTAIHSSCISSSVEKTLAKRRELVPSALRKGPRSSSILRSWPRCCISSALSSTWRISSLLRYCRTTSGRGPLPAAVACSPCNGRSPSSPRSNLAHCFRCSTPEAAWCSCIATRPHSQCRAAAAECVAGTPNMLTGSVSSPPASPCGASCVVSIAAIAAATAALALPRCAAALSWLSSSSSPGSSSSSSARSSPSSLMPAAAARWHSPSAMSSSELHSKPAAAAPPAVASTSASSPSVRAEDGTCAAPFASAPRSTRAAAAAAQHRARRATLGARRPALL
mmetsp:Transcript_13383/g.42009  ORF Transcript_13383/g.42009 Transcript_13383/m.42009 type:complete len:290 (-) Transcript_13383:184-1053(-)